MTLNFLTRQSGGAAFRTMLMAGCVVAAGALAPSEAHATLLLSFFQTSGNNTVTSTANSAGTSTTISGTDIAVMFSSPFESTYTSGFLTFTTTSSNAATGAGTQATPLTQNFGTLATPGTFSIRSAAAGGGVNVLSGTFVDQFSGFNQSANLQASTPPAGSVTFTSDVIDGSALQLDRALSFSLVNITPGVMGANATVPSFTASISGNFSSNVVTPPAVPEPVSMALLGTGLLGIGLVKRRRSA